MNLKRAHQVLEQAQKVGAEDFCLCPGGRNAPLVVQLEHLIVNKFIWPEERSCSFFALGKSKRKGKPTVIISTSGTAAAELLPATIEAYYTAQPLLIITADRPKSFRGSGAPQAIEQVGLYDPYVSYSQDLDGSDVCDLSKWTKQGPAHVNICFSEPLIV